eukprot:CCRYP_005942-RC/>CCRYP_005942-RC protein AED:0.09 eAED:0.09 QI:233/1/1/1/0.6/0.33/6/539/258
MRMSLRRIGEFQSQMSVKSKPKRPADSSGKKLENRMQKFFFTSRLTFEPNKSVHCLLCFRFICSHGVYLLLHGCQTWQTLDEILPYFDEDEILGLMEEPRISEQQIGNFQNVQQVLDAKSERSKFGRFFYRFPSGEAGLDVYNRVSSFIPTLVRDCIQYSREGHDLDNMNIVIVTHGLALRLFLMRWFQFSVHDFEESYNPDNCQLITMTKMKDSFGHAWMELEEKDRVSLCLPGSCGVPRNVHLHRLQALYENRHKN